MCYKNRLFWIISHLYLMSGSEFNFYVNFENNLAILNVYIIIFESDPAYSLFSFLDE